MPINVELIGQQSGSYIASGLHVITDIASGIGVLVQSGLRVISQSGQYVVVQSGLSVVSQSGLGVILGSGDNVIGKTIQTDGASDANLVDLRNYEVKDVLEKILKELKKANLQLSILTDNEIKNTDID